MGKRKYSTHTRTHIYVYTVTIIDDKNYIDSKNQDVVYMV